MRNYNEIPRVPIGQVLHGSALFWAGSRPGRESPPTPRVFEEGEQWYSQEEIGTFGEAEELELLQDFASET